MDRRLNQSRFILLIVFFLVLFILTLSPRMAADAQENQVTEPVYIVKSGDTLWAISRLFNVSLEDLTDKNNISDPSQIAIGARLVIPGYEGLQGVLVIDTVPFGENITSLSRRYQIPVPDLVRLNRWTRPENAAAGSTLVTLDRGEDLLPLTGERTMLRLGSSVFELALLHRVNPWLVLEENNLGGIRDALPGDVFFIPGEEAAGPGAFPNVIESIELDSPAAIQGKTFEIRLNTSTNDLSLAGLLGANVLNFYRYDSGFVALQGIHALQEPGYYPTEIIATMGDGTQFEFSQHVYIQDGGYPFDPPLVVNSETIDVENTQPEDFEWFSIVEPVSAIRMWSGIFSAPVPDVFKACFPSAFGSRRSYNGSAYNYFHTGLDFCGSTGVEIYAPAAGIVVFADSLVVRGNATVIDHGWGVYTAYAHQSEIFVSAGDQVERGQLIGLVGSTGRVTGPHLHWEVIVGGVQVDPLDWLNAEYP